MNRHGFFLITKLAITQMVKKAHQDFTGIAKRIRNYNKEKRTDLVDVNPAAN